MQVAMRQLPKGDTRFKRKTGDEVHASGTIIHWDVRDPADPYWQIGITCHKCRQDRFVAKASIKNPTWRGLCSVCVVAPGLFKRLKGKEKLAKGGEVDWDDDDANTSRRSRRYKVACPNFISCGNKDFKRIDAGNKNAQPFYCRSCFIEYRRSRMAEAWNSIKSNGTPPKASVERDASEAIGVVWRRVRSLSLPFDKRLKLITGIAVAAELGLGEKGSESSADQLRKKLARDGVAAKFPHAKRWFPAYVRSVIEAIETTGHGLSGSTGQ